jgi:hypothetical protein
LVSGIDREVQVSERQHDVLRLQPHMIASLRATFSAALDELDAALGQLRRNGFLAQPWLGDETSSEVAAHYTRRAMEAPDSSYRSLQQYRAELSHVHDTLQRMEEQYRGTDQDAADRYRRT